MYILLMSMNQSLAWTTLLPALYRRGSLATGLDTPATPNLPTNIVDFGVFDSSIILM